MCTVSPYYIILINKFTILSWLIFQLHSGPSLMYWSCSLRLFLLWTKEDCEKVSSWCCYPWTQLIYLPYWNKSILILVILLLTFGVIPLWLYFWQTFKILKIGADTQLSYRSQWSDCAFFDVVDPYTTMVFQDVIKWDNKQNKQVNHRNSCFSRDWILSTEIISK